MTKEPIKPTFPGRSGDDFQDLCTMIGLMTIGWGWCDTVLSEIIRLIIERVGPIDGYSDAPLSMKKKIKCLRRALKTVKILEPLQQTGLALAELFVNLSGRRNEIVHSASIQTNKGLFESIGLKSVDKKYVRHTHRFTLDEAIVLSDEIGKLSDRITKLMVDMYQLIIITRYEDI